MDTLNYHHLRYFREVARTGNLTRAAERLNLSQSAMSAQIRQLEDRLGQPLFDRVGRRLELTEAGRIALDYADRIFGAGAEMLDTLRRTGGGRAPLRVGALSTLSRNFQLRFLAPVLGRDDVELVLRSGGAASLLAGLAELALDVVLLTEVPRIAGADLSAHRLAAQPVAIHGLPDLVRAPDLPGLLRSGGFLVPSESTIRAGFLALAARHGVVPRIVADVDDMAMIRLLAREGAGLAVTPPVVVADELASGRLETAPFALGIVETFFAVTLPRRFPHPVLAVLLDAAAEPL
ncbi:LysR family transcriptional regulator [Thalassococcus sp. CAU 1522]|uniref:LysR family transcriptional regulator n=1 Tax=Thalassococcus arenae TaxID=2851652 RepID=A0ABS6N843_9RHOB|nr:LysR family transcriptional regulator [Thalassococcus arenae]MBV2360187.1 LysR family transcriptional regulator [Thalassococcus arenae]